MSAIETRLAGIANRARHDVARLARDAKRGPAKDHREPTIPVTERPVRAAG